MRRRHSSHDSIPSDVPRAAENALLGGSLRIWQPARGYRVNVDTLLLAAFAAARRPQARRVVDLGAGVGALALVYGRLGTVTVVDLVERDAELALLAERNLGLSHLRGHVHRADLSNAGLPRGLFGVADVVLTNPPFFEERAGGGVRASAAPGGRVEPPGNTGGHRTSERVRAARIGPLAPFLAAANRALGRRAAAFFVYPARSLSELFSEAAEANLVPKRLRLVHAFSESAARLALVELRRAKPGGLIVDPPLVEWRARGVRSDELDALVAGRAADAVSDRQRPTSGRT